ncbi:MAG: chromosomal replication initiator protein DnaA [Planctomycetaceae bacterium]
MTQPVKHGKSAQKCPDASSQPTQSEIIDRISAAIGPQNFEHWLASRSRVDLTPSALRIFVPNPFIANWLLKRFRTQFNQAATALLGPSGTFELSVDESLQSKTRSTITGPTTTVGNPNGATSAALAPSVETSQRPSQVTAGLNGVEPLAVRPTNRRRFNSFTTLVTGDCNDLAAMASRQVTEFPGQRFNPLYIHGPTGVGKTHLLEAIYTEIRRTQPHLNVMYLSSEAFTNYFMQALDAKTVPSFRQRFRNVDVLLVDNIEFLDNKRLTQEEFLHTIVQVIENGGQLVVSGDRHPRLLNKHRDELTTRFMSGLVCRVETPSEETRRRITAALALPMKGSFTQETLDYVARRCRRSVREIQGALNCLHGHFTLTGKRITVARAREILGDMERECQRLVRISDVEKVICDAFGLTATDLRSKSRRKAVSCPRALAMFIARKLTKSAYREIGMYFGGRDHSTVVAAEKRVQAWIVSDAAIELPNSCHGRTISEVLLEIEERLLSIAA